MINTPKFWLNKNLKSFLLTPISIIYWLFFSFDRFFQKGYSCKKNIICIGNLNLGGSGKTPTAIAIGKILKELNINYAFLSRGYRGSNKKLTKLNKNIDYNPLITGDEPLLLKEYAPTYICKNRLKAIKEISKYQDLEAIILDDGYQNNSVKKDLNILVVDSKFGFGNKLLFPAGPLRQTIKSGFKQADIIIVIGKMDLALKNLIPEDKIINASIEIKNIKNFQEKQYIAFCGIAYPQKFFSLLKDNNINLYQQIEFCDHYYYKKKDLDQIIKMAKENNTGIITTKKDWVKFDSNYKKEISFLDIDIIFNDKSKLKEFIQSKINV
tara:strand:+ start:7705 stop:8679 length:975 start_codon:yes stop_codon:yes gene_type:complete